MFTGLVEEVGTLVARNNSGTSLCLQFKADKVLSDLKIDDSIAVDGCCQTVIRVEPPIFEVIAVRETLEKTTLGTLRLGEQVNLERAAMLSSRMGGHLVSGHIDGTATVADIRPLDGSWEYYFDLPKGFERYVIQVGSIAIEGVSLTVAGIEENVRIGEGVSEHARIKVAIIPHTYAATTFRFLEIGQKVNIELDLIAKMVERLVSPSL